jgi:hypothetical protein
MFTTLERKKSPASGAQEGTVMRDACVVRFEWFVTAGDLEKETSNMFYRRMREKSTDRVRGCATI